MRRKEKSFRKPVAAGFGAVYLLTMGLATCLVKEKFTEEYGRRFEETAAFILERASEKEFAMEEEGWGSQEARRDFYQSLANGYLWRVDDDNLQISVGFYDSGKRLQAQTRDEIGGNSVWEGSTAVREYASFGLDDYLSVEEKEQLAGYQWDSIRSSSPDVPGNYRFSVRTSPDGQQLWEIYVQEITWTRMDESGGTDYKDPLTGRGYSMDLAEIDYDTGEEAETGSFKETGSRILWQWTNPEEDGEEIPKGTISNTGVRFPYMTYESRRGYGSWKRWCSSGYLHDFPGQGVFTWEKGSGEPSLMTDSDGLWYRGKYQLKVGMADTPFSYMEIRMESSPWLGAADYMKYVYLAGFVLTLVCAVKIMLVFQKTYDAQRTLEETRRDFANAMAHELKTPLGIIRNFAENLLEHNMEEKRDYYLRQIIGQTEEMDRLVVEMIGISKLDSRELVLKNEAVSFSELVREQARKLEPVIREKDLQVVYRENGDFTVMGDKEYLAKAVWNLLCNGAEHNIRGGSITVTTEKDRCVIENTGQPLDEEGLAHAFDLFYTGDKSRGRKEGHMGMGLFLARKILGLWNLELTLENTDTGIRASIKK